MLAAIIGFAKAYILPFATKYALQILGVLAFLSLLAFVYFSIYNKGFDKAEKKYEKRAEESQTIARKRQEKLQEEADKVAEKDTQRVNKIGDEHEKTKNNDASDYIGGGAIPERLRVKVKKAH